MKHAINGRVRLVSGFIRAAELLFGTDRPDARTLLQAASRDAGLPKDALDDIQEPLEHFLRASAEEARLSALGRQATRWDIHRLLSNLARLTAEERRAPEIRDEPVDAPIFITGIPRSGTTFLHHLMAEDPAIQFPRCWQTIYPYPEPGHHLGQRDTRPQRVETQLRCFSILAPEFRRMHPIRSQSPQECTEISAHVFQSMRFYTTYEMPSYRLWLENLGHVHAYRFHKRFLQHLQKQDGGRGRWVLKCPDHVFALNALQIVYPDARFVFVHRDPLKVIPSVARLTEVVRAPFARRVDRVQIGRQVVDDWAEGCAILVELDRRRSIPAERVLHLQYSDIVARPLDAVTQIYRHFGLSLTPDAVKRITTLNESEPRGGYGQNVYDLEHYGITFEELRDRFRDYMLHFGTSPEVTAAWGAAV